MNLPILRYSYQILQRVPMERSIESQPGRNSVIKCYIWASTSFYCLPRHDEYQKYRGVSDIKLFNWFITHIIPGFNILYKLDPSMDLDQPSIIITPGSQKEAILIILQVIITHSIHLIPSNISCISFPMVFYPLYHAWKVDSGMQVTMMTY